MEEIELQKRQPFCDEEVYITSEQVMNQINLKLNYTKDSSEPINTRDCDNQVEQMQVDIENNLENVNSFIKILQHKYKQRFDGDEVFVEEHNLVELIEAFANEDDFEKIQTNIKSSKTQTEKTMDEN